MEEKAISKITKVSCKKTFLLLKVFPNGGWFPNKVETPKTPKSPRKNRLFLPEFHLSFSQISQKPWGGWLPHCAHLGKHSQKKTYFYLETFPNLLWIDHCIDTGKNLNLPLAHFTSSKLIYQRQEAIRDMMVDSTDNTVRAILIRLMGTRDLYGIGSAPMGYACIASETRVPEFVR